MQRWARLVVRLRGPVLAAWLVALAAGLVATAHLSPLLANSFSVPGTDSERARALLASRFDQRPDGTFSVVFRIHDSNDRAQRARLQRRVDVAAARVPGAQAGTVQTAPGLAFAEIRTALDLQRAKQETGVLRRALAGTPRAYVTGQPAIQHDLDPIFSGDVHRGEAFAVPLTLLVLVGVFGLSLAVLIPFAFAACTIAVSLGLVWLLAHELSMVSYVRNLVELVGLGLAVDYSLLVVHRFREELDRGGTTEDAVARTMATAGRAVVFSGVAVAVGLGLLLAVPVPFIRSMGIGGLLVPVVSVVAALTLQPALLSLLGRRAAGRRREGRFWERLARAIMRRPFAFLAAGAIVLAALAAPVLTLRLTPGSLTGIPASTESVQGYRLLARGLGAGAVTPTYIVVTGTSAADRRAESRLVNELVHDPEAMIVASGRRPPYVDPSRRDAQVVVAGRHEWGDAPTRSFVDRLRDRLVPAARFPAGTHVYAGGAPPQGVDFVDRTYGAFPWVVAGVLVLTFVVLLLAFRSLLLPVKAVLLNLLSVGATYGVLALAFRHPIEAWIPVFLFAALFGLSMDYEVFMVSRMREAHDTGEADADAVAHGLERTGRIVTAAAAIMVVAFAGFAVGRIEGLRQFGFGLAVAVLLDATIVRALLVPSLMAILGRWNWWLPRLVPARSRR